jgi:outer membrane murein-binding lipoprotein Lpp
MEKEKFRKEAKQTIDQIFNRIGQLEAQKEKAQSDVRAKYDEKLAELNSKKKELQAKYEQLASSADDKWEETKGAFSDASASFKEGLSKIASLVS